MATLTTIIVVKCLSNLMVMAACYKTGFGKAAKYGKNGLKKIKVVYVFWRMLLCYQKTEYNLNSFRRKGFALGGNEVA